MTRNWKAAADILGTSETGVRLLVGLLVGPVFAFIYQFVMDKTIVIPVYHHIYFTATGILVCYFCFGWHTVYIVASVVCASFILRVLELLKRPFLAPTIIFVFTMASLLCGYIVYATNDYDVNWTTVQCVLTLKLTSVAFDWSDGHIDQSKMNDHQKEVSFLKKPSLFELLGYSLYFGGLLIGPFFSFKRYKNFTEGSLLPKPSPTSIKPAGIQFLKAVSFLLLNCVLGFYFSDHLVYSNDLNQYSLLIHIPIYIVWVQKVFARYTGLWLLADTSCVLSRMSYNGTDKETGKPRWDGMCNVKPLDIQTCCTIQSMVHCFNLQTGNWLLNYIYKRLQIYNNRVVSAGFSLLFLAVWHGFHAGYYLGLLTVELPVILVERQAIDAFKPYFPPWNEMALSTRAMLFTLGMLWKWMVCAYGMVGVVFLSASLVIQCWAQVLFIVHALCLAWFVGRPLVNRILRTRPTHDELKKRRD